MTPLHGIAYFYDVGFGARAVSRKTPIYFIFILNILKGKFFTAFPIVNYMFLMTIHPIHFGAKSLHELGAVSSLGYRALNN